MNIENTRKEYLRCKEVSEMDLSNWDIRTKSGMEGLKNAAINDLSSVKSELINAIAKNSVVLLATESLPESKLAELKQTVGAVQLDFYEMEKQILQSVNPNESATYTINNETQLGLNNALYTIAMEHLSLNVPMVEIPANKYCVVNGRDELIKKVAAILLQDVGANLKRELTKYKMLKVIENDLSVDRQTFLLYNVPDSYNNELAGLTDYMAVISGVERDEAITYLDNETEEEFVEKLKTFLKSKGE